MFEPKKRIGVSFLLFVLTVCFIMVGVFQSSANSDYFVDTGQSLGNYYSWRVAMGDVDDDGDLDAFVANSLDPNKVWLNDGNGNFTDSGQSLGNAPSFDVALGDVDDDGDLDAFVVNSSSTNRVWLNDGAGNYSFGQSVGASSARSDGIALGDIDGDGDLDAFINNNLQPNEVWFNNGNGLFSDSGQRLGVGCSHDVRLLDLDSDGDLDAFVGNSCGEPNKVWLNDGVGTFSDSGQNLGNSHSRGLEIGDVDGDGDLDAFIANWSGHEDEVWLNDGTGTFIDSGQRLGSIYTVGVALGDVDDDGDLDAFIANSRGPNSVWLNDGTGLFSDAGQSLGTSLSAHVALVDLDGDSDLDAFVANYHDSPNKVWLNNFVPQPPNIQDCTGVSNQWSYQIVDSASYDVDETSLRLDSNEFPHIAYHDRTNDDLRYAHWDGTMWHTEAVHTPQAGAHPSLALDSVDRPHISWVYGSPSYSLMYGYNDGATWQIDYASAGAWPKFLSLALDSSDTPHISYFKDVDGGIEANSLMHAWYDGTWHNDRIDGSSLQAMFTDLDMNSQDRPGIAYTFSAQGALKFAWYDGTWHTETVHQDGQLRGEVNLEFDSSDNPHIVQTDRSRNQLTYYWYDGSDWHHEVVGPAVVSYGTISLQLDSADRPHIAYVYSDGTDIVVRYGYRDNNVWQLEIVARGATPSLILNVHDKPRISYSTTDFKDLCFAQPAGNNPPQVGVDQSEVVVNEGQTAFASGTTHDPDGNAFTLDASVGAVVNNDNGTWSWSFDTTDGPDESQVVTISADDGYGGLGESTFQLTVNNVVPTIAVSGASSVNEGALYTLNLGAVTDPGVDSVTDYIVNWGDGQIDTYASGGDVSHTYTDGPSLTAITVDLVDEDGTHPDAGGLNVTVHNVAPSITLTGLPSVKEGSLYTLNLGAVTDPGQDTVSEYIVHWGDGASDSYFAGGDVTHVYTDGLLLTTISVDLEDEDGLNLSAGSLAVTVTNVAPTVETITLSLDPVKIEDQSSFTVAVTFRDPAGSYDEPYTCDFDLDYDGETFSADSSVTGMTGTSCSTPLNYSEPGVYTIKVMVSDKDGGSGMAEADTVIVIYDPEGGFVTGGGWIYSEAGWCELGNVCAGAEGNANFGFVSKYKRGAKVPTGNTEFNFKAGGLNFHSSSYEWLVVNQNGTNAQYKGEGTINGEGNYKFMLWAKDLDPDGEDTFRIKIWYEDGSEVVVYDNGFDQPIGGGNIVVHIEKK